MKIKNFTKLCKKNQKELKEYLHGVLKHSYKDVTNADGFLYAQGTFPVLLVAHLDTVHKNLPDTIYYDNATDALYSPNGIGADDRCGIYMILQIIKKYNCSVLFCEDEEIGGVGAEQFIAHPLARSVDYNYIIEVDRRGDKDAVFYNCDNPDFTNFICKDFYKEAFGTFSDISVIAPYLGIAAVNLSCGYYNAHTIKEYVVLKEMQASIDAICGILERTTEKDIFEYIEYKLPDIKYPGYYSGHYSGDYSKYYSSLYGGYDTYNDYDDTEEDCYIIEYLDEYGESQGEGIFAESEDEAIGRFMKSHIYVAYAQVLSVTKELANTITKQTAIESIESIESEVK